MVAFCLFLVFVLLFAFVLLVEILLFVSLRCPFLATMSFADYFLLSVWFGSSVYLAITTGFVADRLMWDKHQQTTTTPTVDVWVSLQPVDP